MKRVALYVRVSTEEQKKHGVSVDSQIDALRHWIKDNGYIEAGLYNDAGISARSKYTKRPALLQLLDDCKAGKIDLIAFTKLDRWFRSVENYYSVQAILDDCNVPWRTIWEDYETETSSGMFKVNIMLSIAQAESDRTSERIKAVLDYQRSQGKYPCSKVPYGYKNIKGMVTKDEETKEKVILLFDKFSSTYNIYQTWKYAREIGILLNKSSIRAILLHPAYAGNIGGVECEPYITREQYEININSIKGKNKKPKQQDKVYIFQGLIICKECGCRYSSETQYKKYIDNKGETHLYIAKRYRCNGQSQHKCSNTRSVRESVLEKFLFENLENELNDYIVRTQLASSNIDYDMEIEKLKAKLKRIGDRYEDGDISQAEYKDKRAFVLSEITKIQSIDTIAPPELPLDWQDIYKELDDNHKKAFLKSIIKSIVIPFNKNQPFTINFY